MSLGNIYLIRLTNDNESFFKIGITVHKYSRFYQIMKYGYAVEIVFMAFGIDYMMALNAESHLKGLFVNYSPMVKFGGHTECFSFVDKDEFAKSLFARVGNFNFIENVRITWR